MRAFTLVIALALLAVALSEKTRLYVDSHGDFRIVQFTDIHFGDGNYDEDDIEEMRRIIKKSTPDFVAFTGDVVAGYAWDHSPNWYKGKWEKLSKLMNETQVYYGIALGNHDEEADLTRREVMELDMTNPYSLSENGPADIPGASNFVIPVYKKVEGGEDEIAFNIWFFDTLSYSCMGKSNYGCVEPKTIQWYLQKSKEFEEQEGHLVPGYAFFHIPPTEIPYAWNHFDSVGNKLELSSFGVINSGFVAAVLERGDIKGMFFGHDHSNDYMTYFYDLTLAYGRKTGYGCYNPPKGVKHGGRVINIHTTSTIAMDSYIMNDDLEIEYQDKRGGLEEFQDVSVGYRVPRYIPPTVDPSYFIFIYVVLGLICVVFVLSCFIKA